MGLEFPGHLSGPPPLVGRQPLADQSHQQDPVGPSLPFFHGVLCSQEDRVFLLVRESPVYQVSLLALGALDLLPVPFPLAPQKHHDHQVHPLLHLSPEGHLPLGDQADL